MVGETLGNKITLCLVYKAFICEGILISNKQVKADQNLSQLRSLKL